MEHEQLVDTMPVAAPIDIPFAGIKEMFDLRHDVAQALAKSVQTVHSLTDCEHVFLTRFDQVSAAFVIGDLWLSVTVSIGNAIHNSRSGQCYSDQMTFLHAADQALYQAKHKQQGRNRVVATKVTG